MEMNDSLKDAIYNKDMCWISYYLWEVEKHCGVMEAMIQEDKIRACFNDT
jgi:hypothetical protein